MKFIDEINFIKNLQGFVFIQDNKVIELIFQLILTIIIILFSQ